jgi:DNA repair exonuclease SbcCD ATPase subunit
MHLYASVVSEKLKNCRADVKTLQETIAEQQEEIEAHKGTMEQQQETIAEQQEKIEAHKGTMEQQQETIAEQQEEIEAHKGAMEQQQETIAEQQETVEALRKELKDLEGQIKALEDAPGKDNWSICHAMLSLHCFRHTSENVLNDVTYLSPATSTNYTLRNSIGMRSAFEGKVEVVYVYISSARVPSPRHAWLLAAQ